MKKLTLFTSVISAFIASNVFAHNIKINESLPLVKIEEKGELKLIDDQIEYQVWNSQNLIGKVRVLQHIAGRTTVKEKNIPLMSAIKNEKFNPNHYQTTNIINADDAIFGTAIFVKTSTEEAKKENEHSQIILDQQSSVKNAWQLKDKESLIVVLDKNAKVQYVSEGKLSSKEIDKIINLVKELLN